MNYLAFALLMLAAQFSPGPDMLLLLKNAVNHPFRAGLCTIAGIATGLAVHCTLAVTGLVILLSRPGPVSTALSLAGALYLTWIAIQLLRSLRTHRGVPADDAPAGRMQPLSDRAAFLQGLITNLLNPKAALFLLTVMAQFTTPSSTAGHQLILASIVVFQSALFWSLFLWLLQRPAIRTRYLRAENLLNLLFAAGLLLLAATTLWRTFRPQ